MQKKTVSIDHQIKELNDKGRVKDTTEQLFSRKMQHNFGEFVKLTEVKDIVNEITLPLLTNMQRREAEAIHAKNCINNIWKEVQDMQTTTKQALLMRGTVAKINKHVEKVDKM